MKSKNNHLNGIKSIILTFHLCIIILIGRKITLYSGIIIQSAEYFYAQKQNSIIFVCDSGKYDVIPDYFLYLCSPILHKNKNRNEFISKTLHRYHLTLS